MTALVAAPGVGRFLDRRHLRALARERREGYGAARPLPHAVVDGFLGEEVASELASRFPGQSR